MKKLIAGMALCLPFVANAQFVPGQVLTASELNTQFALYAPLAGAIFSGGIVAPSITVTGTANLPPIALSALATQAANTVIANVTGASASPTAAVLPSCSTISSALNYTLASGFTCNTTVNAASLGGGTFAAPTPIGSTAASTGAFTTLSTSAQYHATNTAAGASILELTGNGATTPNKFLGVLGGLFTIYASNALTQLLSIDDSGNQIAAGSIAPSQTGGIIGTTTNNNANAGSVGEILTNTTSGTALTNNITANATSVSLTAGDWEVSGTVQFAPAAGTTINAIIAGIGTTSATLGGLGTFSQITATLTTGGGQILVTPITRIALASTTTIYLVANSTFGVSTMAVNGLIRARRVR